jgi:hypothetical protein
MDNLPIELQYKILELVGECKTKQNMYINKDLFKIIKNINNCKCEIIFNRKVCTECFKSELRQLNIMFMPYI